MIDVNTQLQAINYADLLPVCTAIQAKACDQQAIETMPVKGFTLMKRAGGALFRTLRHYWPDATKVLVACGGGNNGGDGYVLARLAYDEGLSVDVRYLVSPDRLQNEAAEAYAWMTESGLEAMPWSGDLVGADLIVDALLGIGLQGEVRAECVEAINRINDSNLPVLAVDIPSGLCSDTGYPLGAAVRAQVTQTFIVHKRGLLTGKAVDYVGRLEFDDLRVPKPIRLAQNDDFRLLESQASAGLLTPRARSAHKGHFGHVLVIGGNYGMAGACLLAAEAACRVGAGLVSVATRPSHIAAVVSRRPEVMAHGVETVADLDALIERVSVVVIGPGLGRDSWAQLMLVSVLQRIKDDHSAQRLRVVLDADALNLIAERNMSLMPECVMTPHPGEAARLLDCSVTEVESDRYHSAKILSEKYGCTAVLKGAGTIIWQHRNNASENESPGVVVKGGNPGMATGGMGDVLSGIIGGMIAQFGLSAVPMAAAIHMGAADVAAKRCGEMALLPSDVIEALTTILP